MGQTTTSNSTLINGAAKADAIGGDGDFTFTIADLLANDPGGAAKVNLATQFFFGDTAADQANQAQYLIDHGITDNHDGTYTLTADADDFHYFVQIGNKGTWSTAAVDVTAPEVVIEPHLGGSLFTENFDGYDSSVQQTYQDNGVDVFASVNLAAASGWTGSGSNPATSELGANGYGTIETTTDGFWFDTMNSPGQVDISHTFTDTTAAEGGKTAVLSFDIAKQDLTYQGVHYATDPNAAFEIKIDGTTVAHIDASDLLTNNDMYHQQIDLTGYAAAGDVHTIELVDVTGQPGFTGFAIDSIQINDWVV
jgi:hypothetical protein